MLMISLAGYDFNESKACLICRHSVHGEIVNSFLHDEDGDLNFSCGRDNHLEDDWIVIGLDDVLAQHSDLVSLPVVQMGEVADRVGVSNVWTVA